MRKALSRRNVGQPDHVLAHLIGADKTEPRQWTAEKRRAVAEHDGVDVETIFIDEAKVRCRLAVNRKNATIWL